MARDWWESLPAENGLTPPEWEACIERALRRVTLATNHSLYNPAILSHSDETLERQFPNDDDRLFKYRNDLPAGGKIPESDELVTEEFAEYFYGDLKVIHGSAAEARLRFLYRVTWAFLRSGYEGFRDPPYSEEQLGFAPLVPPAGGGQAPIGLERVDDPSQRKRLMATNYLVKNLWHNYVHNRFQDINDENFDEFKGRARYQSDFEADTLATILLAKSYNLPVFANSDRPTFDHDKSTVYLLRRNRCSKMFVIRAQKRMEQETEDEKKWNYCRQVAVYVGGWLLAQQRAAASVSAYLNHEGRVVVEVNGAYLHTNCDAHIDLSDEVARHEHRKQIATAVDRDYLSLLRGDPSHKSYAAMLLQAKLSLLGVDWGSTDIATGVRPPPAA